MEKILLKGGQVVSSSGVFEGNVLVEDGKIAEVCDWHEEPEADKVFDCSGKLLFPGFIDTHVHLREPGQDYKEDWESGSAAAIAGGVTTVLDMPNNDPPIVTVAGLETKRDLIKGRSYCDYGFYIGFDGKNLEDVNSSDAVAVKFFGCDSTGDMGVENMRAVEELFEKSNKLIVAHAEDEDCIAKNKEKYKENAPETHSKIRAPECAVKAVREFCELADKYDARLHIAHVSTEKELEVLDEYDRVTCEVAPHHLMFCDDDYSELKNFLRVNPPVRSRTDIFALWKGLKFGEIDTIATDHAPHTIQEKERDYFDAPSGVPELDTFGPLLFNAINDEGLTEEEVAKFCCEKPAEIFELSVKGKIEEGFDADIVVVDMDLEKKVERKNLFTKCGWSPYEGMLLKGWPVMTFVRGNLVFRNGEIVGEKVGKECL